MYPFHPTFDKATGFWICFLENIKDNKYRTLYLLNWAILFLVLFTLGIHEMCISQTLIALTQISTFRLMI